MSAPAAIPFASRTECVRPDLWNHLVIHLRHTVAEYNVLAGETVWTILVNDPFQVVVCHTENGARCLELGFRPETEAVRCVYGTELGGRTLDLEAAPGGVRCGKRRLRVAQAAAMLLDGLVAGME